MTNESHRQLEVTTIITSLRDEVHRGPLEQGFIGNRLHGTDVSEFIHTRYVSFVKFLQDGTYRDDFESLPTTNSDSVALLRLSLSRWGFL